MKVLQIDSSILGDASISRQLTQAVVEQLQQKYAEAIEVEYLDLAAQPIPHLTAEILMGQNAEQNGIGRGNFRAIFAGRYRGNWCSNV